MVESSETTRLRESFMCRGYIAEGFLFLSSVVLPFPHKKKVHRMRTSRCSNIRLVYGTARVLTQAVKMTVRGHLDEPCIVTATGLAVFPILLSVPQTAASKTNYRRRQEGYITAKMKFEFYRR